MLFFVFVIVLYVFPSSMYDIWLSLRDLRLKVWTVLSYGIFFLFYYYLYNKFALLIFMININDLIYLFIYCLHSYIVKVQNNNNKYIPSGHLYQAVTCIWRYPFSHPVIYNFTCLRRSSFFFVYMYVKCQPSNKHGLSVMLQRMLRSRAWYM